VGYGAVQADTVDAKYNSLVIGFRSAFFVVAVLVFAYYAWCLKDAWLHHCVSGRRAPLAAATLEQWWALGLLGVLVLYTGRGRRR